MRNTGRLYAFDISGHRLDALKPRLARSGLSNVHPAQIAHERDDRVKRLAGKIDRVLIDAPCSGMGTLRRNPDLKWRQSPQSCGRNCRPSSTAILASARHGCSRAGGRLVYATCSLLADENEAGRRAPSTQAHGADLRARRGPWTRFARRVEGGRRREALTAGPYAAPVAAPAYAPTASIAAVWTTPLSLSGRLRHPIWCPLAWIQVGALDSPS